ncbi:MAG: alpha-D-ribose 1-methylphosphonate 5-triphosphate diphosphatase [Ancalomicrobiaceae bacterium]|nr:alpha-D-ribose 1-methylphosphonate 5-triphosphate diphosphatase [Ancalomicrobiaceae bacterium]
MDSNEFLAENARLVLSDRVIESGWIAVADGMIAAFGEGKGPAGAADLKGDTIIPGLIELHTDHLEPHFNPRPEVFWSPMAAVLAYDSQIAASGITTVFDSLRVGDDIEPDQPKKKSFSTEVFELADALKAASDSDLTRADHHLHLRCEVCAWNVLSDAEAFLSRHKVDLISLMDHTPGQRQFRDIEKLLVYWRRKLSRPDEELLQIVDKRVELHQERAGPHRRGLVELAQRHGIVLASHDDATLEHVEEAIGDGAAIAEFPTTVEAARRSHESGIRVLMGAPNVVRGGSHSGNVKATELAEGGYLDILSSDYIPASLIMAAFMLPSMVPSIRLPEAIRTVTLNPALATGLNDRGEIALGKRADLVRVAMADDHPVVRAVLRQGRRVV